MPLRLLALSSQTAISPVCASQSKLLDRQVAACGAAFLLQLICGTVRPMWGMAEAEDGRGGGADRAQRSATGRGRGRFSLDHGNLLAWSGLETGRSCNLLLVSQYTGQHVARASIDGR
jgi:hypothetical protein